MHSQAHKKHIKALLDHYPGLQDVLDGTVNSYDALYKSEDLHFHLADAANIEATFTPLFGTIIDYRRELFRGGDPRISALMPWHRPERSLIPAYYHQWLGRCARGEDMTVAPELSSSLALA